MKELFTKYFRDASSYQSIDPTCFDLQEFTETWLINHKEQLPIHGVVSSAMYKATFSFKKYSPRGGNGCWVTEIVPIQAKDEKELKEKIATYQVNDHNSYHKHIKLTNIELM